MELPRERQEIGRRTVLRAMLGAAVVLTAGCELGDRRSGAGSGTPITPESAPDTLWTPQQQEIIVDSSMTLEEALAGKEIPDDIRAAQEIIDVEYVGFDGLMHRGQIVAHERVIGDLPEVFGEIRDAGFPIQAAVPVTAYAWDDEASMQANNSSNFNYRTVAGSSTLSKHALGLGTDINPLLNPYIKGDFVQPEGAAYEPSVTGTILADGPVVDAFKARGWEWGGDWNSLKDYQHFEKSDS